MSISICTSVKHVEYDCLTAWSVTSRKWKYGRWCDQCRAKHRDPDAPTSD